MSDRVANCLSGAGGVTGLSMLAESHLAGHTFPENESLCPNLFCERPYHA